MIGDILWEPPADLRQSTRDRPLHGVAADDARPPDSPAMTTLWRWSVEDLEGFWGSVWEFFELHAARPL